MKNTCTAGLESISTDSMRFLLVEDDKICQYLTGNYLRELGGNVDVAETAENALKYLEQNLYSLIFLDIGLPDKSGVELVQEMNNFEEKIKTPVIATTGHARIEQRKEYLAAGIKAVLEKPISKASLSKIIEKFIKNEGI